MLEGLESLSKCDFAAPMQEIKVEMISVQPFESLFASADGAAAGGVIGKDFADQKCFIAPAIDGFADQNLGCAAAIQFGRVDEIHPQIEAEAQCRNFGLVPIGVFAHVPGALAEDGKVFAGGKLGGSQGSVGHKVCEG